MAGFFGVPKISGWAKRVFDRTRVHKIISCYTLCVTQFRHPFWLRVRLNIKFSFVYKEIYFNIWCKEKGKKKEKTESPGERMYVLRISGTEQIRGEKANSESCKRSSLLYFINRRTDSRRDACVLSLVSFTLPHHYLLCVQQWSLFDSTTPPILMRIYK